MIEIKDLKKSFGNKEVLRGVNLNIEEGKTNVIIGASGCGKSVLLKHIVGLLKPDEGHIYIDGEDITAMNEKQIYAIRKKFGFLFQSAALFDSMTVGENVGIALRENTLTPAPEINNIVSQKLRMVDLPGTENLMPSELSGGMRKRVGLARALATDPQYILYDEPTTGLDPITSETIDELMDSVARSKDPKVTSIIVTHDIFTVYEIGDRVAMMFEGKVHFNGTPDELRATSDPIVRQFLERTDEKKAKH
ncbi:MAG TPA: ABC transporter ATP-binding protein [Ignavibacteria bacterium]|nr:ABC transporter ATP-binding protein [Ignavibacteria bacterium]HAX47855.1 ABC transporter ATP-binding protein [Bacteroidota bacterium]HRE11488.1 ABC transporter ATP-binding protein [Ignavibacteria bacterium]HRF66358.1 ABC transporter ATP-binding protein [Ignavibacteria bacterium]HRJ04336.1 ABC transporter ATP-binding protein [Ignavibacteria bacterium]